MKKSLCWRLFTPVICIFVIGMTVIAWYIPILMKNNAEQEAIAAAQKTVSMFTTLRAYYTKNVIAKAIAEGNLKGSFNHKSESNSIPLPATMIHDLSELLRDKGTLLRLYSPYPFPNRNNRQLNNFQKDAWESLNRNPDTVFSRTVVREDGSTVVRVGVADKMVAQACVSCHNTRVDTPKNDWKIGDVRGVLEVETSIDQQLAHGQQISNYLTALLFVILLIIFVVLFISYRITIGHSLESVISALKNIADGNGDLTQRLDDRGEHEIARIGQAFNEFMKKNQQMVSHLVSEVIPVSDKLFVMSTQLEKLSQSTTAAISRQEHETELVVAAVNELTTTAEEISSNSSTTADATNKAELAARSGRELVAKSVNSTNELCQDIQQASQALERLRQDSKNIGGVLEVIKNIAEQTNLLALNAAIEAARAGEQGRGFAVVADEVRTLAGCTQESTQEIHAMVDSLQSATRAMVDVIEKSDKQANSTLSLANEVGDRLTEITDSVSTLVSMNGQIISAVEQQGSAVSDVNGNLMRISEMSQATAKDSYETNNQVQAMAKLASRLRELTGQIRA